MMTTQPMLIVAAVLASLPAVHAFLPVSCRQGYHRAVSPVVLQSSSTQQGESGSSIDWKRAKHCAENFGACDVAEVEQLFSDVHKERVEHQLFGGVDLVHETSEEIEHRIIEEELEVQLNLLEQEHELAMQETQLFPEEMTDELPHLREHAEAEHAEPMASRILHKAENELAKQETLLGEDTLETMAMCAVVMGLVMLPQFIN